MGTLRENFWGDFFSPINIKRPSRSFSRNSWQHSIFERLEYFTFIFNNFHTLLIKYTCEYKKKFIKYAVNKSWNLRYLFYYLWNFFLQIFICNLSLHVNVRRILVFIKDENLRKLNIAKKLWYDKLTLWWNISRVRFCQGKFSVRTQMVIQALLHLFARCHPLWYRDAIFIKFL